MNAEIWTCMPNVASTKSETAGGEPNMTICPDHGQPYEGECIYCVVQSAKQRALVEQARADMDWRQRHPNG